MNIRPLSHTLGAEISGVDIKTLTDETFRPIYAAFLKHSVLVFRGQKLDRAEHIRFAARFGELTKNEEQTKARVGAFPELQSMLTLPSTSLSSDPYRREETLWHSDRTFLCEAASVSILRAVEVPEVGGDTMMANMYVAYETLSEGMKDLIKGLYGIHPGAGGLIDSSTPERLAETRKLSRPVAHPIVKVHPETNRKVLFVGEKIKQFAKMTMDESEPILQYLCTHATRMQNVYRHQWQNDDVLIWDNRCTLHKALYDYDHSKVRNIEKTTGVFRGAPSGAYIYDDPIDDSISVKEAIWRKRMPKNELA